MGSPASDCNGYAGPVVVSTNWFKTMLNRNSRCSIMWQLKMSTRTSRMCLFTGWFARLSCWWSTKRSYYLRCVRSHSAFWMISSLYTLNWMIMNIGSLHMTITLLRYNDHLTNNWRRRYRKQSFHLSSLVFRCCCKNQSDDRWKWRAKLHYFSWYIILPRNSNTGI